MGLRELLEKAAYYRLELHDVIDSLESENNLGLAALLQEKPLEPITIARISDGTFDIEIDFNYNPSTRTYSISGHLALDDRHGYGTYVEAESEVGQAYPLVHEQVNQRLDDFSLPIIDKGSVIELLGNRRLEGSFGIYIYSSNEYNLSEQNADEQLALFAEEISVATVVLSSLFDMFRVVVNDIDSNLSNEVYASLKHRIGASVDLMKKYVNIEVTKQAQPDLDPLIQADKMVIPEGDGKKYRVH